MTTESNTAPLLHVWHQVGGDHPAAFFPMSAIDIDGVLFLQGFAVYDVPNYRRIVPATYSAALVGDVIPAPDLSPGGLSDAHAAEQRSILARFPGMMG